MDFRKYMALPPFMGLNFGPEISGPVVPSVSIGSRFSCLLTPAKDPKSKILEMLGEKAAVLARTQIVRNSYDWSVKE